MKFKGFAIYNKLDELGIDSLFVSNPVNVEYLSGFKGQDCYFLVSAKDRFLITDSRNYQEAKETITGCKLIKIETSIFHTLTQIAGKLKAKSVGFEARHLDYASFKEFSRRLKKVSFKPTAGLVEDMRKIKDRGEISLIRKAAQITRQAFSFAAKTIKPSLTENQLIASIEGFIRKKGAAGFSFPPIASSGRRSAFPHASSTDNRLGKNTAVTLDMGIRYHGYCSDLTRVLFLGRISCCLQTIYLTALSAQERAIREIKPGVRAAQIDSVARTTIEEKGFGPFFQHSTGHGLGLEVHEKPFISRHNQEPLIEGMVLTVEPAIYLPGRFGVRVEEMVLVTKNGSEVL